MKSIPITGASSATGHASQTSARSAVMLGATGAVGGVALQALLAIPETVRVTTLGRRPVDCPAQPRLTQHTLDVTDPLAYAKPVAGHDTAICTLGVGQPSKVSREALVRLDKDAVIAFATACKRAGVRHFELLGALGSNPASRSFYLRTKGELEVALEALGFERLSLFQPSMILTPVNRYGLVQAMTLAVWPKLHFMMQGGLQRARGIPVEVLGTAMARNLWTPGAGVERLTWRDFMALAGSGQSPIPH